jgi:hypothetical protein
MMEEMKKRLKYFGCIFLKKFFSANKEGSCPDRNNILVFPGGTEENHGLPPSDHTEVLRRSE